MELQTTKSIHSFSISRERLALILLMGQSFFLGYAFALLYTIGNSLFLVHYGSDYLPYAFIAIAVVVPLFSAVFSQLQKIWLLPRLAWVTIAFFASLFFLAWGGLTFAGSKWLSFALLVGFTLGGLFCGIVRGAQAGYIFDARTLKQMYPLIMGGEILGVIAGGVSSTLLPGLLGNVENILLICGGSMFCLLFLLLFGLFLLLLLFGLFLLFLAGRVCNQAARQHQDPYGTESQKVSLLYLYCLPSRILTGLRTRTLQQTVPAAPWPLPEAAPCDPHRPIRPSP